MASSLRLLQWLGEPLILRRYPYKLSLLQDKLGGSTKCLGGNPPQRMREHTGTALECLEIRPSGLQDWVVK